jgi:polyisoprenoid-binding protein YceI
MKRSFFGLFCAFLLSAAAWGQATEWQIDPAHTNAAFTVRHMGISNVHGHFTKLSGKAMIDENDPGKDSVEATLDANSIDTGVEGRDKDLRSEKYFDVQKFPTLTFKSKSVTKSGNGLKVVGDLTMHGVTKEVTLDVDGPSAPIKRGQRQSRGLSATTTVNRNDFGIGSGIASAMIGDSIKIDIDCELTQQGAAPAGK